MSTDKKKTSASAIDPSLSPDCHVKNVLPALFQKSYHLKKTEEKNILAAVRSQNNGEGEVGNKLGVYVHTPSLHKCSGFSRTQQFHFASQICVHNTYQNTGFLLCSLGTVPSGNKASKTVNRIRFDEVYISSIF